jgi:ABC-2 type transport system permease protein
VVRTVFRYRLKSFRGQILGWGIALALLGVLLVQFYGTISDQQQQLEQLLESYPKEFIAFFGDFESFATPSGYLSIEFFSYMPLIMGIFAVLMGSGLLASDEESGRLDLIMAHPVSRTVLYSGRVAAFVAATLAILTLAWAGLAVPAEMGTIDVSWHEMLLPFLSLLAALLFFGTLAVLLSQVLPSRRMAAMVDGLLLVASYFMTALARINADLQPLADFSPLEYYQGGEAIDGLNLTWFLGLLAGALLFAILGWWRFQRRDIRVGGEGGWRKPKLLQLRRLLPDRFSPRQERHPPKQAPARR